MPDEEPLAHNSTHHAVGLATAQPSAQADTRRAILWIALIPALAAGYYFAIALPSYNEGRLNLERQKYADEQAKEAAALKKSEEVGAEQARLLDACFEEANNDYFTYVRLNGTVLKNGNLRAGQNIWDIADRRKNEERQTCLKRYPPP